MTATQTTPPAPLLVARLLGVDVYGIRVPEPVLYLSVPATGETLILNPDPDSAAGPAVLVPRDTAFLDVLEAARIFRPVKRPLADNLTVSRTLTDEVLAMIDASADRAPEWAAVMRDPISGEANQISSDISWGAYDVLDIADSLGGVVALRPVGAWQEVPTEIVDALRDARAASDQARADEEAAVLDQAAAIFGSGEASE